MKAIFAIVALFCFATFASAQCECGSKCGCTAADNCGCLLAVDKNHKTEYQKAEEYAIKMECPVEIWVGIKSTHGACINRFYVDSVEGYPNTCVIRAYGKDGKFWFDSVKTLQVGPLGGVRLKSSCPGGVCPK